MMDRSNQALNFAARLEKQMRLKQKRRDSASAASVEGVARRTEAAGPSASADPWQAADRLAATIEEIAAVSGRFDPNGLMPADATEQVRLAVLSRLASSSSVEAAGSTKTWLLDCDRRIDTLKRLVSENRLATALQQALPATDRFGEMLREVLRDGRTLSLDALSREDLLAVAAAVEATADVEVPKPDVDKLRQLISQKQFLADYDVLIEKGFFGREAELRRLESFLGESAPGSRQWSGLVLTGLGGAGKSTLLAKFASDAVRKETATVVILDFDRPGVDPSDTPWLEMEIAGRVGLLFPRIAERLEQLTTAANSYRADINVQQSFMAERKDVERTFRDVVSEIHNALKSVGADARPVLLVLDTFEEVTQRGLGPKIIDWLDEIAESLWPTPLKVIFSGRLFDNSRAVLKNSGIAEDVELTELEPYHAQRLLEAFKVPAEMAGRLATSDVLPRRPLELKLLARLVLEGSSSSIDELEDQLRKGGKSARELFAGLVYRRVLLRIRDETARALAYPGLVLRFVTPELVEKVLAPALDVPLMDEGEAARALDALAGYDWLAYRGPNGEVWHRKDLRRSMLKAMIAEDPQKAERISRSAAEHFASFTEDRLWAEAVYHRLMLVRSRYDGERFELDELKVANEYIAGDIADLPPESAALLRLAAGHELSPSDVPLLPDRYLPSAYDATGTRCVNSREFGLAAQLCTNVRRAGVLPDNTPLDSWEVETWFATVWWDALAGLTHRRRPSPRNYSHFADLADVVFPQAVISPSEVDRELLERGLAEAERKPRRKVDPSRLQTQLSRLSVGLVLLAHEGGLSDDARGVLAEHVRRLRKKDDDRTNPLVDRRMLLLEMISRSTREAHSTVRISPWTIPLSHMWLEWFSQSAPRLAEGYDRDTARDLVSKVSDVLTHGKRGRLTVRSVLGTVNALESPPGDAPFAVLVPLHKLEGLKDWALLRGPDPEFRDPCRFALLDAFGDDVGRRRLAAIFAEIIPLQTVDLEPAAFVEAIGSDPEHALESYVEIADRAGMLQALLNRARKERPARKLELVEAAYARWIEAVHAVFLDNKS